MKVLWILAVTYLIASSWTNYNNVGAVGRLAKAVKPTSGSGILFCDGAKADYRLMASEIFGHAFIDITAIPPGTRIETVWIGPNKTDCTATRYPKNTNAGEVVQKSYTVVAGYNECGFLANLDGDLIKYTTYASATILHPSPAGGVSRRKTYRIPLQCHGALINDISSGPVQYFNNITYLEGVASEFDVTMSAKLHEHVRETFGNFQDVNSYAIELQLDADYQSDFLLSGNRCWITPNSNPSSGIRYDFIMPQGCNNYGPDFVSITEIDNSHFIYEVADITFDQEPNASYYYFHCTMNICTTEGGGRCERRCDSGQRGFEDDILPSDLVIHSERVARPNRPSHIRIGSSGEVYLVNLSSTPSQKESSYIYL